MVTGFRSLGLFGGAAGVAGVRKAQAQAQAQALSSAKTPGAAASQSKAPPSPPRSSKTRGDEAETLALRWLQAQGLSLVQRNYRLAGGPRARGAEVDLVMREPGGTLVFVEVRLRGSRTQGGAAASVTHAKQRRIVLAAQHFLMRLAVLPPCRFDVVAIDGSQVTWLQAAFDAS